MSAADESIFHRCANCGVEEADDNDVKLKKCSACHLVRYCSIECQKKHRSKHKQECKKRVMEVRDEILFRQPESSHLGDCPICCLPMPIDEERYRIQICCSQIICLGCLHTNNVARSFKESRCPFCRHLTPETDEECEKLAIGRAKVNNPIALRGLGSISHRRGDYDSVFHYLSRAAALGDVDSIFNLSVMYRKGEGVKEDSDKEKALLEKAAIAGHPDARFNLGFFEGKHGSIDRAVAHWIIAAAQGHNSATKALKDCYKDGNVSKEDFAAALRTYQAAVDAAKSPQREAAEAWGTYYGGY